MNAVATWLRMRLSQSSFWVFLVALALLLILQLTPSGQSMTIEARTLGARLTFSEKRQAWRLPRAVLCKHLTPIENLTAEEAVLPFKACSANNARPDIDFSGSLSIGKGVVLDVNATGDGGLRLKLISAEEAIALPGGATWQPKDDILLTRGAWEETGTLRFDGEISIGHEIEDGTRSYLIEGRYVVRERLILHLLEFWHARDPIAISNDELFLGDSIHIALAADEPAAETQSVARGFLAAVLNDEMPGFHVVASNTPYESDVTIRRFQSRATKLEPRWIDRVRNDPMLMALSAILTLAGAFAFVGPSRS